jgi:hypothetical protein
MTIEQKLENLLFEDERRIVTFEEVIDILTDHLPRLKIEELKNVGRKWGSPNPIPFDYGELPDLINPADNMGWDVIIAPDADKNHKFLRITGYVPVNDNAHLIPPPNGNKPGNHKLILGEFGKTSNGSMIKLKKWFQDLNQFDDIVFLNQNNSNMYHHAWKRKKSVLKESHVMYYAGTSTNNKVKDKLSIWNKEPVIVTADINEARDIAKDVCRRNGGNPVIYKVQPMGKMLPVHDNSTVTFIVDTANVVGELDESWEKATFGSYKLGHVNDGRWGGVAVGPTAKKMVNRLKESLDKGGTRATSLFSHLLLEKDEKMDYRVFCDMDGVLVDFAGGFKKRFDQTSLADKIQLKDEAVNGNIEKQLEAYFRSIAKNEKEAKAAKHRAKAYFWAVVPGLDLGFKKRAQYTPEDWSEYEKRTLDFWTGMEWLKEGDREVGKELWNYLTDLKKSGKISELNILSSPSSDTKMPNAKTGEMESRNLAREGKMIWLRSQPEIVRSVDNIIIKANKFEEATGPGDILIDDTETKLYGNEKKKGWEDAGGTGVLYVNLNDTLQQLKDIGL